MIPYISKISPKKLIVAFYVVQFLVLMFVESSHGIIFIDVVSNTLIFSYGLYLVKKSDYVSLRFLLILLIIVNVLGLFLGALWLKR